MAKKGVLWRKKVVLWQKKEVFYGEKGVLWRKWCFKAKICFMAGKGVLWRKKVFYGGKRTQRVNVETRSKLILFISLLVVKF